MPVGFALSRQFYDTLGNEVANELVTMLNTLDEAYRSENRELFNAHSGRLEARLGSRIESLDLRMSSLEERLSARMTNLEERLSARMTNLEEQLSARMTNLEEGLNERMRHLEERVGMQLASLEERITLRTDKKIEVAKAQLIRWMFFFWVTSLGTMVALLKL